MIRNLLFCSGFVILLITNNFSLKENLVYILARRFVTHVDVNLLRFILNTQCSEEKEKRKGNFLVVISAKDIFVLYFIYTFFFCLWRVRQADWNLCCRLVTEDLLGFNQLFSMEFVQKVGIQKHWFFSNRSVYFVTLCLRTHITLGSEFRYFLIRCLHRPSSLARN